jgi:outer membrane protein assembly factor BamB
MIWILPLLAVTALGDWPLERGSLNGSAARTEDLPAELDLRWRFQQEGRAFESTPVVVDGQLFIGDMDGTVYCLSAADGQLKWHVDGWGPIKAAAGYDAGLLVVADIDGLVRGLDAQTGKERWQFEANGEIDSGPAFDQQHVLIAAQDGRLYCLNREDGSLIWTYETSDQIRCSPTVVEGLTLLGGCDGQMHIIDVRTGQATRTPLPLGSPTGATPAVVEMRAAVATYGGEVLMFDLNEGKELWRFVSEGKPQEYQSSPAATRDVIVASSKLKQVVAIDAKTGEQRWSKTIRRRADASPVITGQSVWLPATDGRLYRLDLATGESRWEYETKGQFLAAPAIANQQLYVSVDDGSVLCFGGK